VGGYSPDLYGHGGESSGFGNGGNGKTDFGTAGHGGVGSGGGGISTTRYDNDFSGRGGIGEIQISWL